MTGGKSTMTSRARLLAALAHEMPDRVPMDLGATPDSTMILPGYERLKQHLGMASPSRIVNRMMQAVEVEEPVLQALGIDTRGVYPQAPPPLILEGDRYRDEWGVERMRPAGALYYDQVSYPLSGEITERDIARYPWPDPDNPVRTRGVGEAVRRIRQDTEYAVVLNLPSAFVHTSQYLRGFEDWFMDLAFNRRLLGILFDAVMEVNLGICRNLLKAAGDGVDVVFTADDLGFQGGLMMAPDLYRDVIKPRHRRYLQAIHELTPAKVLFHTCGSVVDIMDDLIELGVDILNPVQVSAAGMDPATLKQVWGDRLCFWGGIDTQHLLPRGSVEEVRAGVERQIGILGRGGGYVLGAVHNIQPDVPPENVVALFRHARE